MKIEINGNYLNIGSNVINLKEIISVKPQSLVQVILTPFGEPKEIARDYPKIIIVTKNERFEISYNTDEERDENLKILNQKLAFYYQNEHVTNENPVSINVAESTNVNIITSSKDFVINQKQKTKIENKIDQLENASANCQSINNDSKEEIKEILEEIRT